MPFFAKVCLWNPWLVFAGTCLVALGSSWGGIYLRHRLLPHSRLREQAGVAGILFSSVALLYAVLLAFVVISVWDDFKAGTLAVQEESGALMGMVRILKYHPHPSIQGEHVKAAVDAYARSVIREEFPAMNRLELSTPTADTLDRLYGEISAMAPATGGDADVQQALFAELQAAQQARMSRLFLAQQGLPMQLWLVILLGGLLTISFSIFLSTETLKPQALMTCANSLTIALVIYAIMELNYPFLGSLRVSSPPYQYVIDHNPGF